LELCCIATSEDSDPVSQTDSDRAPILVQKGQFEGGRRIGLVIRTSGTLQWPLYSRNRTLS